jgi:hypothetical protein
MGSRWTILSVISWNRRSNLLRRRSVLSFASDGVRPPVRSLLPMIFRSFIPRTRTRAGRIRSYVCTRPYYTRTKCPSCAGRKWTRPGHCRYIPFLFTTMPYRRTPENKGGGSPIVRTDLASDFWIGLSRSEQISCPSGCMSGRHPNRFGAPPVCAGPDLDSHIRSAPMVLYSH